MYNRRYCLTSACHVSSSTSGKFLLHLAQPDGGDPALAPDRRRRDYAGQGLFVWSVNMAINDRRDELDQSVQTTQLG